MIPRKIYTGFAKFEGTVSVNDFRLPIRLQKLLQGSLSFLWSFGFARICLDPLSGQVLHHDCISVIVSRFAIVTEDLVICCYQITKIFSTRYSSTIASSARSTCNFGPFYGSRSFGLWWNEYKHCVHTNPHVSWVWAPRMPHERNWLANLRVLEFRHPQNFLWILAPPPGFQSLHDLRRQTTGRLVPSWVPFLIVFRFFFGLVNIRSSRSLINRSWHSYWRDVTLSSILSFPSMSLTYFRWWRRTGRRCCAMTLLSWKGPRSWWVRSIRRIAGNPNPVFEWDVVFDHWSIHRENPFSSQSFPSNNTAGVFSKTFIVKNFQFFEIHCCLFMHLHFSIGGYDYRRIARFRQSIHFSITQVLFADHMHRRTGVDNKFSFHKFKSWCKQAQIFRRWEECCSFLLL